MIPIKHILNENGVSEIFKFIVSNGAYSGTYVINKPVGWNQIDSVVDINDESLYVENFIIADSNKLKFGQIDNPIAFNLLKNVYNEQKGDAKVVFKWIAEKDGVEYDLLKDNFEINFNKYSAGFDKSMQKIESEIIKSESQNKLFNREDITVNLFSDKDLDDNEIDPVPTFDIGYKKGDKRLSNFYTYDISQSNLGASFPTRYKNGFFSFRRSDDYEFGTNTNQYASYRNFAPPISREYQGDFIGTNITLPNIKVEISNLHILVIKSGSNPDASLYAVYKNGSTTVKTIELKKSVPVSSSIYSEIKIDNEIFSIDNLQPNYSLTFDIISNEDANIGLIPQKDNTSIEITTNLESPLVKTKGVRIIDCLDQLVKNYTESELSVISNIIGPGGFYYDTSISTGIYLRGLPTIYLNQKIKTSFKSAFSDGASKLMVLGYDILDDKVVIEDFDYFFKDFESYDLSEKVYLQEGYSFDIDKDIIFNSMQFGSKKYSTNVREDIKNFITTSEFSTPIKSVKNKLDKETELIIDEFKIQELIEDKTTSTNDNDDDLVLIDMVNLIDYWDTGVFENCAHSNDGGNLVLNCVQTPFDTTMIEVGSSIEITEGLNAGNWIVLSIDLSKMKVNKTVGIEEGVNDTPIRYKISSLTKNRTNDGFTDPKNIRNFDTATNIRHNPKYHMARWFPWFGSGMTKKLPTELIKATDYKNNSTAEMKVNSADLLNELPDLVVVGADETLGRLRNYKAPYFSGDKITISYKNITFEEFISIYENWRYGEGNDRLKSRGYLTLNTPLGIYQVAPFGKQAFKHSKEKNILTINGKVKGKSVENPVLLSVVQTNTRTVILTWDFIDEYINTVSRVQYSLDGFTWVTMKDVINDKTTTIESDLFLSIMSGTDVYFRVLVSSTDYLNKVSNTIQILWQFNDWIVKEISRTENINCGYSYLTFELIGNSNVEVKWSFNSAPGGGSYKAIDLDDNSEIISFNSPYGDDYNGDEITIINLNNETKNIYVELKNTNKTRDEDILFCSNVFNYRVFATLYIEFKNTSTGETRTIDFSAITNKRYLVVEGGPIIDPT